MFSIKFKKVACNFFFINLGAENAIFSKCVEGDIESCNNSINYFARQGLRTLALAYKILNKNDFEQYDKLLLDAYNDVNNRDKILVDLYEKIESEMVLIGSTAVEDRLQEDVSSTLETLRKAGIKIWVLTGDKKETAINISHSCSHFSNEMQMLTLTDMDDVEQIKNHLKIHYKK